MGKRKNIGPNLIKKKKKKPYKVCERNLGKRILCVVKMTEIKMNLFE